MGLGYAGILEYSLSYGFVYADRHADVLPCLWLFLLLFILLLRVVPLPASYLPHAVPWRVLLPSLVFRAAPCCSSRGFSCCPLLLKLLLDRRAKDVSSNFTRAN